MSLMLMACRGPGSDFSTTPYQTNICSSSGTLRIVSM